MAAEESKLCKYVKSNGEQCKETSMEDDDYCFWHTKTIKKDKIEDIAFKLEKRCKEDNNLEGFYLPKVDLKKSFLIKANFKNAHLEKTNFSGSSMFGSNFENANLFKANFEGANLRESNLVNADILGTNFNQTKLERVEIGKDNKIRNEIEAEEALKKGDGKAASEKFLQAEEIYRNLKTNFLDRGLSHNAGKFFYKEMTMKRKQLPQSHRPLSRR